MVITVFNCDIVMIEESIDSKRKKEYAYSIYVMTCQQSHFICALMVTGHVLVPYQYDPQNARHVGYGFCFPAPEQFFTPIIVADIRGSLLRDEIYPLPHDLSW
jgi:hypothetical protein